MDLTDWLNTAEAEQSNSTNECGAHLYANFRYAQRTRLVRKTVVEQFEQQVGRLPSHIVPDEDYAGALVFYAAAQQYDPMMPRPAEDFRLIGRKLKVEEGQVFVNIAQSRVDNQNTTSHGAARMQGDKVVAATPRNADSMFEHQLTDPPGILWLTRIDAVLAALATDTPHNQESLFIQFADLLGLKPQGGTWRQSRSTPWDVLMFLRLFRTRTATKLTRPHTLSAGYSDRFLAASSPANLPYGSTARCSDGRPCLPEAIGPVTELEEISPSGAIYQDFCAKLKAINGALVRDRLPHEHLSAVVNSKSFEPQSGYLPLQAAILAQL